MRTLSDAMRAFCDTKKTFCDTKKIICAAKIILLSFALIFVSCWKNNNSRNLTGFAAERAKIKKSFRSNLKPPGKYDENLVPLPGVDVVEYKSDSLTLKAWLGKPAVRKRKYPAVVFLHNLFHLEQSAWLRASAFLDTGFVVLAPMLRGENGNPGNFEFFLGEVDDVIAAGEYLAKLSFIDKDNIFLAGNGVGANLAILASLLESPFCATAAINALPLKAETIDDWQNLTDGLLPFNKNDKEQIYIRSPLNFISEIKCPLFLFADRQSDQLLRFATQICNAAHEKQKKCNLELFDMQQFSLKPAIIKIIREFKSFANAGRRN